MTNCIPRLEYEELEGTLARALEPKFKRLGYLGEFFKYMGHQPRALLTFFEFTEESKKGLPDNLGQLIALTVSTQARVGYERNQHERLSVRMGFGRDWVAAVEQLDPDNAPELQEHERAVQRFVLKAIAQQGHDTSADLDAVVKLIGHKQAIAMLMVLARYVAHGLIVNSLDIKPPVPSIFEDGFEG